MVEELIRRKKETNYGEGGYKQGDGIRIGYGERKNLTYISNIILIYFIG